MANYVHFVFRSECLFSFSNHAQRFVCEKLQNFFEKNRHFLREMVRKMCFQRKSVKPMPKRQTYAHACACAWPFGHLDGESFFWPCVSQAWAGIAPLWGMGIRSLLPQFGLPQWHPPAPCILGLELQGLMQAQFHCCFLLHNAYYRTIVYYCTQ